MRSTRQHARSSTLEDVARRVAPHMSIVTISNPTPHLREHNVIAVLPTIREARRAVLALEAIDQSDAAVGLVLLGMPSRPDQADHIDPDRATGVAARRSLVGGLVGAVGGAVVVGGSALVVDSGEAVVGAAFGGAALFAVVGAMWAVFAGFGMTDAYRETFVDPALTEVALVSLHTDEREHAEAGVERLHPIAPDGVVVVDGTGRRRAS